MLDIVCKYAYTDVNKLPFFPLHPLSGDSSCSKTLKTSSCSTPQAGRRVVPMGNERIEITHVPSIRNILRFCKLFKQTVYRL